MCSVNLERFCEISVINLVLCGCGEILLKIILFFFINNLILKMLWLFKVFVICVVVFCVVCNVVFDIGCGC